jgi:endonuclease-3
LLRKEVGRTTAVICHENPFVVLISTVLSQRTKDINTEKATKLLFSRYKNAKQLANAPVKSVEKLIYGTGFYKTKAKRIKNIANVIISEYKGKVPDDFDELMKLKGVGRKTANCVLVYAFRKQAIPVDTHVNRIANRLGLVKTKTPEETEKQLVSIVPKRYWIEINELMVKFGQRKCFPRNPRCDICSLRELCNYHKEVVSFKR